MSGILFLTVHRPKRSPSQRFRFEQYIPYFEKNGLKCEHYFLLDEKGDKTFYSKGNMFGKLMLAIKSFFKLLALMPEIKKYDFVFVQRECFMLGTAYFEKRISRQTKLIYDFDDSIWLLDVSDANKKFAWLKNPDKTSKIISVSNTVVAGNNYLAEYAKQFNKNVRIIPTTVEVERYLRDRNENKKAICIGWSGSLTTIKHFQLAVPILLKLKQKYGPKISFKVIGEENYVNEELEIKGTKWTLESEIKELAELDIGIMPLRDDQWSKGKCGLKGLQYMALGIPAIMSPVGVNTEIVQDGENGFLADSEKEWIEKLSRLIESEELRNKLGRAGQQTVKEKYSVESQKDNYLSLFR